MTPHSDGQPGFGVGLRKAQIRSSTAPQRLRQELVDALMIDVLGFRMDAGTDRSAGQDSTSGGRGHHGTGTDWRHLSRITHLATDWTPGLPDVITAPRAKRRATFYSCTCCSALLVPRCARVLHLRLVLLRLPYESIDQEVRTEPEHGSLDQVELVYVQIEDLT
jgi:hypothetical protein